MDKNLNTSAAKATMPIYPDMCQYLGIGKTRGYQLAAKPDFPAFRIGKKVLVSREKLDAWIEEQISKKAIK